MRFIHQIHRRYLSDKDGNSRGWQAFVLLTVIGVAGTAFIAMKSHANGHTPMQPAQYFVLPVLCTGVGAMMWLADVLQRRKFARDQARTGVTVEAAVEALIARKNRRFGWLAAVFGITFVPVGAGMIGVMMFPDYASLTWTATPCRVTDFGMDKPWNDYQFRITVVYSFAGGEQDALVNAPRRFFPVTDQAEANRIAAEYAPGTTHELYVNPHKPTQASLLRGPRLGAIIGTVSVPVFTIACMVGSIQFMRKNWPRRKSHDTYAGAMTA